MDAERTALVEAYWLHHLLSSGERAERLQADEAFWAWEAVEEAMCGGAEEALSLLNDLLAAPKADACFIGAGPLENLLIENGATTAALVVGRCRDSAAWRAAVACVWLDAPKRRELGSLEPFFGTR